MKVLVTGATGFVGSHLCDLLEASGHEVFCLIRSIDKAKQFNVPGTYLLGSLSHNKKNSWVDLLPSDLDAVVHTAGIVHSMETENFYKVNTDCSVQLLSDLKEKYNSLNFVFISSLAAAGPVNKGESRSETSGDSPVSIYGKSKKLAEDKIKEQTPANWNLNIIRPPMVIGPRDPAVLDVFKMISNGLVVTAGMNGHKNEYSFVCVYDLIETIKNSLTNSTESSETYFSSFPKVITLDELYENIKSSMNRKSLINIKIPALFIKMIAKLLGVLSKFIKLDIRLTPDKVHELLPSAWVCDSSKSQRDLSMTYNWDLDRTVKATLTDYRNRDWL
ncbi:hypothetical protein A9Q84_11525 [Halobacteriovorax marinus]|uniref:NAD-dependent epimerase/dehydratase domain-containing protein n=1 Tax=Halobacteriovorax marinus TaxID=97084 RepID=A0A1Y5FDB2_9BACT|nr:hypothetical protein A9Q84_11525 [Halobacteriovorax marinus]